MELELEDIANLLCVLCLVFGLRLTHRLDALAFWVLTFRVLLVFLTNDVLFPVSYMPDQVRYIRCAIMYRVPNSTKIEYSTGEITSVTILRTTLA